MTEFEGVPQLPVGSTADLDFRGDVIDGRLRRAVDPRRPVDIVVGIQWGDEGKGRVVDLLARDYAVIARFGGGDNAGHSIEVGDTKLALHVVPSGVLVEDAKLLIGAGTVVSLRGLVDELDTLAELGSRRRPDRGLRRARTSSFRTMRRSTGCAERQRGSAAIGTTGRGIGPAYVDRVERLGITFGDLAKPRGARDQDPPSAARRAHRCSPAPTTCRARKT